MYDLTIDVDASAPAVDVSAFGNEGAELAADAVQHRRLNRANRLRPDGRRPHSSSSFNREQHLTWHMPNLGFSICLCVAGFATADYAQQAAPHPLEKTPISPVRVVHRNDGVYFIDFGRDAFAQLQLNLSGPIEKQIKVRLGEKLASPDRLDSKPGGSIRYLETTITDGFATLTKNDARRMPGKFGPVMPFRYVELTGIPTAESSGELAKAVLQLAVTYPFQDRAAEFASSDSKLNAVWELSRYSIKATSFAGIFVDGDRERKPYEADAFINGLGWYCCSDDLTLAPYTDHYLIDHPTWPTEWQMFSVLCAWNDYLYTGDLNALRQAYPDLKAKSLFALERADGLISSEHVQAPVYQSIHLTTEHLKDIVDWPVTERDRYEMKPVNTVVNAFHCRSLILLSRMATALHITADAEQFRAAADRSVTSLNAKLFDNSTGLYVDGEGSAHSSQHANMFPLAFGLVPLERRRKVVGFLESRGMACSVYGAQFLMDGLFDNHAGNEAVALMLAPGDRSWRHMVEDTGSTLTLEAWDQKYKPNQDWNHAWGAAPANLIPRKILGVEPIEPGFSRALIWPRCVSRSGTVTWARGKVPTTLGPISVDWKVSPETFQEAVELPPGTRAKLRLPTDWGTRIVLDHAVVNAPTIDGAIEVEVASGRHEVSIGEVNDPHQATVCL